MSTRRLVATGAGISALAVLLAVLCPAPTELVAVLSNPQASSDATGPDTVVVAACAVVAWLAWSWGALGLTLTAVAAIPGALGTVARLALRLLVPGGVRRAAAVALGV